MLLHELQELLIAKVDESLEKSGIQAIFIDLDNGWGIKVFHKEAQRDFSYRTQLQCLSHNLAPKVGSRVNFTKPIYTSGSREYLWGLFVEKVELVTDSRRNMDFFYKVLGWRGRDKWTNKIAEKTGWKLPDPHDGNWGFKNELMIPIDFGLE